MAAEGVRSDPYRGFNFKVIVDGLISDARFAKVSGLNTEIEVVEYREGTDNTTMRKLPGLVSYDNITLERGISQNSELIEWYDAVIEAIGGIPSAVSQNGLDGNFRKDVTIQLLTRNGEAAREWKLSKAWPCKLAIGDLDASSSDTIMETIELCHEGLTVSDLATSTS